jgi:mannosyltransferase OCH1-like enzyme
MIHFSNKKEIIQQQRILLEKAKQDIQKKKNYNQKNSGYIPKKDIISTIPLHLYTCWHTKDLPPLMKENHDKMIELNKEIEFHLYDEAECKEFIKSHFNEDVLYAYESLVPSAYKADLWRYCVLYIHGGIYMDIKFKCINHFKLIELTDKEYFVKDIHQKGTLNGLIISKSGNPILLKCIEKIVEHVKNNYYGQSSLDPTGPNLLGEFTKHLFSSMELKFESVITPKKTKKCNIVYKNKNILTFYDHYRDEQKKYQNGKGYSELWRCRNIYH